MYIDLKYIFYKDKYLFYIDPETYLIYVINIKVLTWTTISLLNLSEINDETFKYGFIWQYVNPYDIVPPSIKNNKIYVENIEGFIFIVIHLFTTFKMVNEFATNPTLLNIGKEYLKTPEENRNNIEIMAKIQKIMEKNL